MRVVFDTNIFIAAALKGGFAEDIIKMAASKQVSLLSSEEILSELHKKLTKKFKWSNTDAVFFVETIKEITEIVDIKEKISFIKRDTEDNKILECAVSGNADLIASSDQDLIQLKQFEGIGIIHPKTFPWIFPEYFKKSKG